MDNKTVLFALALVASPPCAGIAAADRLSEGQMDRVTAGALTIECPNCGNVSMSSGSISVNGVTTNTSSTGGSGSGGSSNSASGSSGNSGNSGSGNSGSSSGSTGLSGPSVATTISVPANLTAIINNATKSTVTP